METTMKVPEVIYFNERGAKKRERTTNDIPLPQTKDVPLPPKGEEVQKTNTFDIKRARYEVMRFGIGGFDKQQQTQDKISLAIRLGAKPPRKEYVNYKKLMEERKINKQNEMAQNKRQVSLRPIKRKPTKRKRIKKK